MKYDISYGDSRRVRMQFSPPWESGGGKVIFRVEYGADEIVDGLERAFESLMRYVQENFNK